MIQKLSCIPNVANLSYRPIKYFINMLKYSILQMLPNYLTDQFMNILCSSIYGTFQMLPKYCTDMSSTLVDITIMLMQIK